MDITEQEFEALNNEQGYELMKGTVDGMSSCTRALKLFRYVLKNFYFPMDQVMKKETYPKALKMQFLYHVENYHKDVRDAFLSPKQVDYIAVGIYNWAIDIANKKRIAFQIDLIRKSF